MSRVYNFSPGPAMLPEEVLQRVQHELLDWEGRGMSVMEMSHRGNAFMSIATKSLADLRELLAIPDNYRVLFLQGGATGQFAAVPMNLLGGKSQADYINTGIWSKKAIEEAGKYCRVNVAASAERSKFTTIPLQQDWKLEPFSAYVHYTPNETIGGVEYHWIPETGAVPLVADMSSTILSRPFDVSKYGVIYAGAQKNIGPAGLTIVIVREDLVGGEHPGTPAVFSYKTQLENDSMYNTPSSFCWYVAGLVFDWLKQKGGLARMAEINRRKADKLYKTIDDSGFYSNPVDPACRSWMNIPFTLQDAKLDAVFLQESAKAGLVALKGHRSVGGMRASIYNAMPEAGVDALVGFMKDFEKRYG
ncbi:MAG: phosphoserine aminotransferase [Gammaproteobacteria bacterium]|nr:MAG: phosphoserine aminotransferase [Gammaproteobacteria bacterium]TND07053.1 MAG: phosphoserine aminotransferase [Gammaproteobacteria bacterium]